MELFLLVVYRIFVISISCYMSVNYSYWWLLLLITLFADFTLYFQKSNIKKK